MTRAFLFPGQGAQTIGMGQEIAAAWPAAKAVFEEVDDALGEKLSTLIQGGEIAELTLTRNAQPALMATSMAALAALKAEGVKLTDATFVAGHSLGEYTALCAAGAISLGDTARLLRRRGEAMQNAVPQGQGAMAALLELDFEVATAVAQDAAEDQVCVAANDNAPGQVVVSGHRSAVMRAVDIAKANGAKRAVMLPVSAPFHCALMEPAAAVMARALDQVDIQPPVIPLVGNVNARAETSGMLIRDNLVRQVTGSVRWRESVMWMAANGVTETWEIGAGRVLSGMVRRIDRCLATRTVGTPDEVKAAAAARNG
ncbi:MAG: ACP S-malonyltransferase [Rhodobacteraceae bacterium]|nr:ACP S-malonyltransferase [Paracoccaceae bacterium]